MPYTYPNHSTTGSATVMATVALGFASFVNGQGVDAEEIFDRAALKLDLRNDPSQPISLGSFLTSVDIAADITQNENFGLWLGSEFRPEDLGILGYLCLSSPTLGDALTNMARLFPLFQRQSTLKLSPYRGKLCLEYQVLDGAIVSRRHDSELTLGVICNLMRRALGDHWSPLEVHLTHTRPMLVNEHMKVFRCDVRFSQPTNAIVFNLSDLRKTMPGADPQLFRIIQHSFSQLQERIPIPATVRDRARAEIVELIQSGPPRLDQVADRLGVPSWTLSRQLREEGCAFSELIESSRKVLTCHYLQYTSLSVSKVAELAGYAETSSFSHAFNRWFGMSPKRWRAQRSTPTSLYTRS